MSRPYTKEERAMALGFMFEVEKYPERKGAVKRTAKKLRVATKSLQNWQADPDSTPPPLIVAARRAIRDMIEEELAGILQTMAAKREQASFGQLATAFGILTDKKLLLDGGPNKRVEHTHRLEDARAKLQSMVIEADATEVTPALPESTD